MPKASISIKSMVLENDKIGISLDKKTGMLTGLRNKLTGETYKIGGDSFMVEAAEFRLESSDTQVESIERQNASLRVRRQGGGMKIEEIYTLGLENHFVEKRVILACERDYGLKKALISRPLFSDSGLKIVSYRYSGTVVWSWIIDAPDGQYQTAVCTYFGRTAKGGFFAGVELPFDASSLNGRQIVLGYEPSLKVKAGERLECEPIYFGVYRRHASCLEKEGAPLQSESDAMVAMTSAILGPPRHGMVAMACGYGSEMDHGAYTEETLKSDMRSLDFLAECGIDWVMDSHPWGGETEKMNALTEGQKYVIGDFPRRFLAHAKKVGVKVMMWPTMNITHPWAGDTNVMGKQKPFRPDKPDWLIHAGSHTDCDQAVWNKLPDYIGAQDGANQAVDFKKDEHEKSGISPVDIDWNKAIKSSNGEMMLRSLTGEKAVGYHEKALSGQFVEWQSEIVQKTVEGHEVTFRMAAGMGCNLGIGLHELFMNGRKILEMDTRYGVTVKWQSEIASGKFETTFIDENVDLYGLFSVTVNPRAIEYGRAQKFEMKGKGDAPPYGWSSSLKGGWFAVLKVKNLPELSVRELRAKVKIGDNMEIKVLLEAMNKAMGEQIKESAEKLPEWYRRLNLNYDKRFNREFIQWLMCSGRANCLANGEFLEWLTRINLEGLETGLYKAWGSDGDFFGGSGRVVPAVCMSDKHDHLPKDSNYACERAFIGLVASVRRQYPDIFIELMRPSMDLGVWSLRNADASFTILEAKPADNNPPLYDKLLQDTGCKPICDGQPLNVFHGDLIRVSSRRRMHHQFVPHYRDQALAFPEQHGKGSAFDNKWPSDKIDYVLLSGLSCTPNQLYYLPTKKGMPEKDKVEIKKWLDWGRANERYLLVRKDLPDWPQAGKVDGSAHIIGDHGYVFLFNPNPDDLEGSFVLDESIGVTQEACYRVESVHPSAEVREHMSRGQTIKWKVPAQSVVLIEVRAEPDKC